MVRLNIPFSEKDRAKEIARQAGTPIRWEPDGKFWYFPGEKLPAVLAEFSEEQDESGKQNEIKTHVLAVDYTYMPFAKAAGASWDPEYKVCTYRGRTLPLPLTGFEPQPFSWEEWVEREINNLTPVERTPTANIKLRPHQEEAVTEIQKSQKGGLPGFLLADDVGLGKTITTWASILKAAPNREQNVLIVCPLSVVPNWRNTLLSMGVQKNRVVILNYDRLKKIYELEDKKAKSLKGVAKFGKALAFDIVILDEAHKLKNITSARSKLAVGLYKAEPFIYWLSATAGQNPLELAYLAPLLSHRTGDKISTISKDFEVWCKNQDLGVTRGKYGKWELSDDESSNERIHNLLFKRNKGLLGALRRRPQDIAGWPEIQRIANPVELTPQSANLYNLAWEEFKNAIKQEIKVSGRGKALKETGSIGNLIRLRQKASMLKVENTTELTLDLLDNGRQVAISTQFLDPARAILEELTKKKVEAGIYSGSLGGNEREALRVAYQKGEKQVIIFTVEEGISLHAGEYNNVPRTQINHDPRWSAISAHQIDGRSHRDGTFAPIYWSFLRQTIEERVVFKLLEKMSSMQELHGDKSTNFNEIRDLILDTIDQDVQN